MPEPDGQSKGSLREIALLFLKLGIIGFGGPAAHIAMMQDEIVTRRKWMSEQHFLDLVGATNLIPGPNSMEMSIHCGFHRGGWRGLLLGGASFALPAVLITGGLAWVYAKYHTVPAFGAFLFGIKPAVLAVILRAVFKLGQKALKEWLLGVVGLGVLALSLAGVDEIIAILAGGIVGMAALNVARSGEGTGRPALPLLALGALSGSAGGGASGVAGASLLKLFLSFLKIGSVLFGSGYVLVAYLDGELVERLGWLTKVQLLDAIAIGQLTPGPVLSTSTFVGYQIQGVRGAMVATLGIFLPSFIFVAILNPLIPKLRRSRWTAAFLDAVNISAVGLMVTVTVRLGRDVLVDWQTWVIALLSLAVTFGLRKVNSAWIVLGSACLGYLLRLAGSML